MDFVISKTIMDDVYSYIYCNDKSQLKNNTIIHSFELSESGYQFLYETFLKKCHIDNETRLEYWGGNIFCDLGSLLQHINSIIRAEKLKNIKSCIRQSLTD